MILIIGVFVLYFRLFFRRLWKMRMSGVFGSFGNLGMLLMFIVVCFCLMAVLFRDKVLVRIWCIGVVFLLKFILLMVLNFIIFEISWWSCLLEFEIKFRYFCKFLFLWVLFFWFVSWEKLMILCRGFFILWEMI